MQSYPKIITYALSLAMLFLGSQCTKKDSDTAQIKQETAAFKLALFSHDVPKLSSLLAPDAESCNLKLPQPISGNENIAASLSAAIGTTLLPDTHVHVEKITSKGRNAKTVKGLLDLHQADSAPKHIAFALDFTKQNGSWRIQKVNYLPLTPPPTHYEQLKELNWLAGTWVNEDEDRQYTATYSWDLNNNFLVQHFSEHILGHKQQSSQQQIGWDAQDCTIRSWVFDSDGSVGQAKWIQDGKIWYVTVSYILPDGSTSSATHVFTKLSNNKYTFATTKRCVNGQHLEDIGPYTAVKVGAL